MSDCEPRFMNIRDRSNIADAAVKEGEMSLQGSRPDSVRLFDNVIPGISQIEILRHGEFAEQSHQRTQRAPRWDIGDRLEKLPIKIHPRLEISKHKRRG